MANAGPSESCGLELAFPAGLAALSGAQAHILQEKPLRGKFSEPAGRVGDSRGTSEDPGSHPPGVPQGPPALLEALVMMLENAIRRETLSKEVSRGMRDRLRLPLCAAPGL